MKSQRQNETPEEGFTRLDLLIVLVLLALMLLPALARTKTDSRAFQCLNNNRELNRAWRMWSDDNQDHLLYSGELPSNPAANARVWLIGTTNPFDPVYWDPQASIAKSPMWPYCGTNLSIWRCPSDQSYVLVNGVRHNRVRSYAMNFYLGGFGGTYAEAGPPLSIGRLYLKLPEIVDPSPGLLFVFADVRNDTFPPGYFVTDMTGYSPRNPSQYEFGDFPAVYHDEPATFSFADGRGEVHRWQDRRTTSTPSSAASPNNPDIAWLQDRATRPN